MFYGLHVTAPPDICPTPSRPRVHGTSNLHTLDCSTSSTAVVECPGHLKQLLCEINVNTPPEPCKTTRTGHGQAVRAAPGMRRAGRSFGGCGSTSFTTAAPVAQEQKRLR
eukprot:39435-Chlamydomonas_euryale.AAC.1